MRKILHIFLSLVIVYASTSSAYAVSSVGGWTALDTITAGATNTINATKTAGGKVLNSAITVGASASKVGKHLIKGGGSVALAFAMVELADGAIDWVLDPVNNSVKWKDDSSAGGTTAPSGYHYVYTMNGLSASYFTLDAACKAFNIDKGKVENPYKCTESNNPGSKPIGLYYPSGGYVGDYGYRSQVADSVDNPAPPSDWKSIPIDVVAAKVISNAEAGHAPSQEAVKATALEGFAAGEHDVALDAAATEAGTENPPDTENPPKPDDPAVPFDPSSIIAAINALKAMLAGILSSMTGFFDFFQDTPPEKTQKETDVDVEVPPDVKNASEFDVDYVSFGGQCPVMSPFSIDILGASSSMNFDMTPLCNLAVTIRPAIIAIAYFIGLGVIASAIRET